MGNTSNSARQGGLFLTADDSEEVDLAAMEAGAVDYLVKSTLNPRLLERAIRNSTKTGQLIVDCFGGSGSTLLAAEVTGSADIDELKVKTIYVEQGTTLKRFTARAKGRGNRISKPTCHVYVTVGN